MQLGELQPQEASSSSLACCLPRDRGRWIIAAFQGVSQPPDLRSGRHVVAPPAPPPPQHPSPPPLAARQPRFSKMDVLLAFPVEVPRHSTRLRTHRVSSRLAWFDFKILKSESMKMRRGDRSNFHGHDMGESKSPSCLLSSSDFRPCPAQAAAGGPSLPISSRKF